MVVSFAHTHAYPGCRVTLRGDAGPEPPDALAEFSDGSVAGAHVTDDGTGRLLVAVDGYRTAKGTDVSRKVWVVRTSREGSVVLGRSAGSTPNEP